MLDLSLLFAVCFITLVSCAVPDQLQQNKEVYSRIKKRSYYPSSWAPRNSVSPYNAAAAFKASPYTIRRPYIIPVYGNQGGNLMFYPPQPVYMNPGSPIDNPIKRPYQGPTYLPPKKDMNSLVPNRIGGDDFDDDDDRPIWGPSGMVQIPLSNNGEAKESEKPTRPPTAVLPSVPPLIHNQSKAQRPLVRTTTIKPAVPSGPSNCVWAIISCCSVGNPAEVSQNCFEQRGCPGPFWGDSPCTGEFAKAAISSAVNYYNQNHPNARVIRS
ncbi:unnamed protein product [Ceutorhynchus assimilis]|uniref:Uncharacterized protein n=1 Tax=Ceutorhynchus assimilis TaxID=467358 RepID=A0A9N9MYR1_9CUCU|nr:unnamed protein product [Ceutorhynchus assimilis]